MLKIATHTLGCKVNQYDTDTLLGRLIDFIPVPFTDMADIYIINTCTVTHISDKKSRQMIRRARKLNANAFIAVCGCMAKNDPNIAQTIGADYVFDAREPEMFLTRVKALSHEVQSHINSESIVFKTSRTRSFIKIQDGCDRFCAYCIVPYVRGLPKSRPMSDILEEAEKLIAGGTLELVLTGIQVASYGDDLGSENLAILIKNIATLKGLKRLRLSSIDPCVVDDNFLDVVKTLPVLCSHFHLSLQSGCNTTLTAMNRRYTTVQYVKAIEDLRKLRPNAAITTDIIVGFPNESDLHFQESLNFVREMKFAQVHVFEYSQREGTPAATFTGQISSGVKSERSKLMRELALSLQKDFLHKQVGKTLPVLFESKQRGHTENYCTVLAENALSNTIQNVKITESKSELLFGDIKESLL
ncbi:MAG: tRNA (N(6)-L-threonylcarbamoyladenosine(37)-C(2))-methylthiotransferase MtaB [Defluviitaleaceae bacterium]|nr:tRNA (N(6)-L-threonylcarbamoyladenosine(37)-C(2))-methylthiotransferase MtaB [Defluviitaleaceae bacterium]